MVQSDPLEKLASTGLLKREPPGREEIAGLLRTGAVRLEDARKASNAAESRDSADDLHDRLIGHAQRTVFSFAR